MRNNPGACASPVRCEFQSFSSPQEGIARAAGASWPLHEPRAHQRVEHRRNLRSAPQPRRRQFRCVVNNYIAYVAKRIGVDPSSPIPPALLPQLSQAMREFETGKRAD
jgi:hypothetical protein